MKPTPTSHPELSPLLAFGAHPDDIEFGCGAVVALESAAGRPVHLIVCSRGESGTHGTPAQRTIEARKSAAILGAAIEFVELDSDAHLQMSVAHAIKLAAVLRRIRPALVLAPTPLENQHPDHARLGKLARDACRLARYGGVAELASQPAHAIAQLFFYAITPHAEPPDITPLLVNVSARSVMAAWKNAMAAHASQTNAREYVELQLAQARTRGLSAGVDHAIALFPADPVLVDSLAPISRGARRF